MGGLQSEGLLSPDGESVLALFMRIGAAKTTGLLTLEWDKFKKQIAFRDGEPVLVKSNWPLESFAQFLVTEGLPAGKVKEVFTEWEKEVPRPDLNVWMVSKDLVAAKRITELHVKFFRFRVFNMIWHKTGKFQFKELPQNYDFGEQAQHLDSPFLKIAWDSVAAEPKDTFFHLALGSRLDQWARFSAKDFPIPLSGSSLREWNSIVSNKVQASQLTGIPLRLLTVASILGMVDWISTVGDGKSLSVTGTITNKAELERLISKYSHMKEHEILGVDYDAPIEKCKEIYHQLILKFHPDRMPDPEMKRLAESIFSLINGAFTTMTDPQKRLDYQAGIELDKMGGVEALQKRVEAEMKIPQAQQSLRRRHFRQALEAFEEIQKALPDDGEVLADKTYAEMMWIIETKQNLKLRLPKLKQSFDSAILLRPRYGAAYYYRGLMFRYDNQLEKALHDFDEAIALDPNLSEAQSEARLIRVRSGKQKG